MFTDIYNNFKIIFNRLKHKKIALYGYSTKTKAIISKNKDFNIVGIIGEKTNIRKKYLYNTKLLSLKDIKLIKPIIIIVAKPDTSKIIYKEIEFLKKFNISIFFLDGTTELPQTKLGKFKKFHIKYRGLNKLIKKHDIVSFDLYDTLIYRGCSKPKDVFHTLDFFARKFLNLKINLYSLRVDIENNLQQQYPNYFSLDQIYHEISRRTKLSPAIIKKLKYQEKKIEYLLARPNKHMIRYFDQARRLKKKIIITTDFYMDKKFIKFILKKCKIYGYNNIFVSSEIKKSKLNKKTYSYIKSKFNKNNKFLHIGDDKKLDIDNAEQSGFTVCHITNSSNFLISTNLSLLYNFRGTIFDKISLGLIQNKIHTIYNENFNFNKNKILINDPFFFGYIFLGPLIFSYLIWLIQLSQKLSINKIFFCSREGYALIKIYKTLLKNKNLPKALYFKTSRRLAAVTSLTCERDVYDSFKIHRFYGNFKDLLKTRFNIKISRWDLNKNRIVNTTENFKLVKSLLKPYVLKILQNAKIERNYYLYYIKNIVNFKKDRIGLSDMGYYGTSQRSLMKITKKKIFFGMYMATSPVNKEKFLYKKKYGFYKFPTSNYYQNHYIFESIMTAPHGSYLYCKNKKNFVTSKKLSNQKIFNTKKIFHSGIQTFCKDFVSVFPGYLKLDVSNSFSDIMYAQYKNKIFDFSKKIKNSFYFDNEYARKDENLISF